MRICGAGWVGNDAYGAVRKQLRRAYTKPRTLHRQLAEAGLLDGNLEKAGRFDPPTRRAFCAAALALHDAGFSNDGQQAGLIGTGSRECAAANFSYFSDYAGYGRKLARANLFIYTLPTSPLAEIAIHFKLGGPLFFTSSLSSPCAHLMNRAHGLIGEGEASSVLTLWMEQDFTAALLLSAEEGDLPETFQTVERPEQLIHLLEENI